MQMKFGMAGPVVITIILAASCALQTEVIKLYDDPSRANKTYKRLLVIDISSDQNQRIEFENELVATLRRERVDAVPSNTMIDGTHGVLQDDIDRASDETATDGILITHIASVDTTLELKKGREEVVFTCRRGNPAEYFLYDHEVLIEPDSVKLAHTVVVITNLYDARSRKRVWTIQSTCFEKATMPKVLLDEADAIVKQLLTDQLI